MTAKQIEAFLSCIKTNGIDTSELYAYLNTIHPGDFHFTNGTHFPVLIPGLYADGVFADEEYYLSSYERERGKTTYSRANNYCNYRGVVLPSWKARDNMEEYREKINSSLYAIGFPLLSSGKYWAQGDTIGDGSEGELQFNGGGVEDTDYYSGSFEYYKKYVRGCIRVSTTFEQVKYTPQQDNNQGQTPADFMLKIMGISRYDFGSYKQKEKPIHAGDYLLKDGTHSEHTVYDQELGIYINMNQYLELDMPQQDLSMEQVSIYLKMKQKNLPDYFDLRQVEKVVPLINKSLAAVGMKDYALPEDVVGNVWCVENFAAEKEKGQEETKKRLLLIGQKNNVDNRYLLLDDIWKNFSMD